MNDPMRVLVTGAAGRIGMMLTPRLPPFGYELRLLDRAPVEHGIVGDVTDPAVLDEALSDRVGAIVHLAAISTEAPWPAIRDTNIDGTFQVFEAARRNNVPRLVYASSNHAVGFEPRDGELPADVAPRPDILYGVSKVFGEALGRYYCDRYGLRVACLRIGTCRDTLPDRRSLATWLSADDCARLVDAALRAPDLTFTIVWGVSANRRRWWSLEAGRAIGYEPLNDAETFASEFQHTPTAASDGLVGGEFTTAAFDIDAIARRD